MEISFLEVTAMALEGQSLLLNVGSTLPGCILYMGTFLSMCLESIHVWALKHGLKEQRGQMNLSFVV